MEDTDRPMRQADHDLLVSIHTKLERVISDVKDLSINVTGRIDTLENVKTDKSDFKELQKDVQWLQRIAYGAIAILSAIQFYFNVIQ